PQPAFLHDHYDRFVAAVRPLSAPFGGTSALEVGRKGDADGDRLPGRGHRRTPRVQSRAHQTSMTAVRLRAPIRTCGSRDAVAPKTRTIIDTVSTGRAPNLGTQPAAEASKGAIRATA